MANYSGQIGSYDHPFFTMLHERYENAVQGPASATDFAHFRSRNKILLRAVHVWLRSNASATSGSLHFTRSAVTIASKTVAEASVTGAYSLCITLTTNNTLHTITEFGAIRMTGAADKGKWDVLWEYQVLYPSASLIGS
jgi:hypothetical protein